MEEADGDVHRKVARNNRFAQAVFIVNLVMNLSSHVLMSIGVWIAYSNINGGVAAYIFREGFLIKSPIALGLMLFLSALISTISSFVLGMRQVAPSIVEGYTLQERRIGFAWFLITSGISVVLFSLGLFSGVTPWHRMSLGVTLVQWRGMTRAHPDQICKYEMANKCAGYSDQMCTKSSSRRNPACPGHYCQLTCMAGTVRAKKRDASCYTCMRVFAQNSNVLSYCRVSESRPKTAVGCKERLRADVRSFLMVLFCANGIGMGSMIITALISVSCALMSASV